MQRGMEQPFLSATKHTVGPGWSANTFVVGCTFQVDRVGGQLLARLRGGWGLGGALRSLRSVYLLAAPALQPFTEGLFRHGRCCQAACACKYDMCSQILTSYHRVLEMLSKAFIH